jgi:hypothetical protein
MLVGAQVRTAAGPSFSGMPMPGMLLDSAFGREGYRLLRSKRLLRCGVQIQPKLIKGGQ